jgi:hypothetical protein
MNRVTVLGKRGRYEFAVPNHAEWLELWREPVRAHATVLNTIHYDIFLPLCPEMYEVAAYLAYTHTDPLTVTSNELSNGTLWPRAWWILPHEMRTRLAACIALIHGGEVTLSREEFPPPNYAVDASSPIGRLFFTFSTPPSDTAYLLIPPDVFAAVMARIAATSGVETAQHLERESVLRFALHGRLIPLVDVS